jgi:hypothetical protein
MRSQISAGPVEQWFPRLLRREGDCLLFMGSIDTDGYGQLPPMNVSGNWGSTRKAHRLAFALANGYLPLRPREVCHTCDVPACCEPTHLYDGTSQQNHDDMVTRGRSVRGRKMAAMNVGESNHFALLTAAEVVEIRRLHSDGRTIYRLAREYGVSWGAVSLIVKRKHWRHI